ncbi:MAG TPA: HAMP domain-containing sensor histidine kinase [Steroidobacteraceae bacterium]|jgi:two-component system sensor histidine kinase PilS (NtrC family)|nr:HAMP domain-containing sensor histidine kinase [Steroidobacteraceae bacterium]
MQKPLNRHADNTNGSDLALNWRVLGLLNLYRVLVPLVLLGLYSLGGARGIAVESTQLFFGAAAFYLCFGLFSVILVRRRLATANFQTIVQAAVDITVLMAVLHACGGVSSGLGLLLLVPVGSLAFLLPPRSALFLAAVTIIAVLVHTIWQQLTARTDVAVYATAGLLGIVLFTIAAAASFIAGSMRQSEALVRQKDLDLANLAELSQYIVQHLRESLLVVDGADRIRLINESAAEILGDQQAVPGALAGEVSPRLLYSLSTWRNRERGENVPSSFVAADGARLIQPHFAPLGGMAPGPTLIFLEDTSLMAERVQQGKLAALGRLSASIAHEIRNPVGAMSHAGQLLAESPAIGPEERRLTDIIRNNSERVSTIINNVLQLSRREATKPARLNLGDWLEDFLPEFCETMQVSVAQIGVHEEADDLEVRFDPSHLHQVVWNLCDNAIKYGETRLGISVEIKLDRLNPSGRPYLEVADRGPGIEVQSADRIFEPFFTGRKGGTGLGLFIARELCQLNRAILLYEPRGGDGSIFRIVFSDPQRWEE